MSEPRKIAPVFRVRKMGEDNEAKEDRAYWMSRPWQERIEAVQILREQYITEDEARKGLQRVLSIRKPNGEVEYRYPVQEAV